MKNLLLKIKIMFADLFSIKKDVFTAEGKKLPLNLQFFAESGGDPVGNPEGGPPEDPEPNQDPKNEPPVDPKSKDKMIPKSRFDEVNKRAKDAEAALQKIKDDEAERERQAKEKQGEYETLYQEADGKAKQFKNDYETAKEKADRLEGIMTSMLNTKLESVPEEYHDLIPDNLSPEQKLDWITKAETKGIFGKKKSEEPLGGSTNPPAGNSNFEDMSAMQLLSAGYGSKQ